MRYYKIVISNDDGSELQTYSSLAADGRTAPGALNVEMDIPAAPYATPIGGSIVRVWGIPLQQISQARDLNSKSIAVYGGMAKGLPLATAAVNSGQQGLLVRGSIFPAFGNWIGTEMTLDLILAPPFGSIQKPANIVHNWVKGTPLSQAITQTLKTAFPKFTANVNISSKLVLPDNDVGYYQTIGQYAEYLRQVSKRIIGNANYSGVDVALKGDRLEVYDRTVSGKSPKKIQFQDMIGQPTWIGVATIQVKTVMRADIAVGDEVTLPPALATVTAQSSPQFRDQSAFKGTFTVIQVRHVGNYRQPDAASWNTTFDVAAAGGGAGT